MCATPSRPVEQTTARPLLRHTLQLGFLGMYLVEGSANLSFFGAEVDDPVNCFEGSIEKLVGYDTFILLSASDCSR